MKSRLTSSLFLFAMLMGGCASTPFTKSTVVDRHIKNATVGVSGFEMTLPEAYYRFVPQPDNAKTTNYAQLAWDFSAEADTNSGLVLEKIPFAKPGYGITLSIYSTSFYVPSPIDLYYKEIVDRLAQLVVLEKCDQVTHEAVQVGSHYVAKVGGVYTQKKMYTVIYQMSAATQNRPVMAT